MAQKTTTIRISGSFSDKEEKVWIREMVWSPSPFRRYLNLFLYAILPFGMLVYGSYEQFFMEEGNGTPFFLSGGMLIALAAFQSFRTRKRLKGVMTGQELAWEFSKYGLQIISSEHKLDFKWETIKGLRVTEPFLKVLMIDNTVVSIPLRLMEDDRQMQQIEGWFQKG